MAGLICPVCGGRRFQEFRGRQDAQCSRCGSLERHRQLALYFLSRPEIRRQRCLAIVNSPELAGIGRHLDLNWRVVPREHFLAAAQDFGTYDLVAHEHVLSGTALSLGEFSGRVAQHLAPAGAQVFCTALPTGQDRPDLDPTAWSVAAFDPTEAFGPAVFEEAKLGGTAGRRNANSVFVAHQQRAD